MKKSLFLLLILTCISAYSQDDKLNQSASPKFGGSCSPYLVGTFINDGSTYTSFTIINPTVNQIDVLIAFFKPDGTLIPNSIIQKPINHNGLFKFDSRGGDKYPIKEKEGVVKIISTTFISDPTTFSGIVGFQKNIIAGKTNSYLTESNLAAVVDFTMTKREYEKIKESIK